MAFKPVRVDTTEKEEDEEGDEDCNVNIVNNGNKKQNRCSYSIGFGLVLLALVITVVILIVMITTNNEAQNNDSDDPNNFRSDKELAAGILDGLKLNNSETNIDLDLFNQAFDVFDNDKDGYLDQTEFGNYFEIELQHSATFKKIDIDNDNILSYPEVVTYISALSKIDIIFDTIFKEFTIPTMISTYDYGYYNNNNITNDNLFNEYASMIMYFDVFDLDQNGYITFAEYASISINNDFQFADVNADNKLSKDELFTLLYGEKFDEYHHSFSGLLHEIFNDDVNNEELFVKSLFDVSITSEQVTNINLNLCPQHLQSNHGNRRRLQVTDCCLTQRICEQTCIEEHSHSVCPVKCREASLCCTKCHCAKICGKSC